MATTSRSLIIDFYIPGASAGYIPRFRFNSDTAGNYSFSTAEEGGARTGASTQNRIETTATSPTTNASGTCHVTNPLSTLKIMRCQVDFAWATVTAGTSADSTGAWNNTTAQITTVELWSGGATTYNVGSWLVVWSVKN